MKFELSINNNIVNKGDPKLHGWVNTIFSPEKFMQHILDGKAFSPSVLKAEAGNKKPKISDISHAQLLAIDIDNDIVATDVNTNKKIKRCKNNDEGYLSFDAIMEDPWYHDNALLCYTTPSHTDAQNRFRIVLLLPEIIYNHAKFSEIATAFINKYGADKSCKNIDRMYFGNTNAMYYVFGQQLSNSELYNILNDKKEIVIQNQADILQERNTVKYTYNSYDKYSSTKLTEEQVADMLSYIPKRMDYSDWGKIVSAVGNYFDEATAVRLIDNWSPDENMGTTYKIRHRSDKPNIASVIYFAEMYGYDKTKLHSRLSVASSGKLIKDNNENDEEILEIDDVSIEEFDLNNFCVDANIQQNFIFWVQIPKNKSSLNSNDKKDFTLKISKHKMIEFLENRGYRKIWLDKSNSILVQVINNIVEIINEEKIIDYIKNEIKSFPYKVSSNFNRNDLLEIFLNQINNLGSKNFLRLLTAVNDAFIHDTKNSAYFFFENNVVQITKDNYKLLKYSDLNGLIWKEQIIDKAINKIYIDLNGDSENPDYVGQFELFLKKVCSPKKNEEQQRHEREVDFKRFYSLTSAIGYMLHTFKDPTVTKAVILCEEKIAKGDESNGRTGKGVTAKAIAKLRKQTYLDGKKLDFTSQFFYQLVDPDTQIIYFDDVQKGFDFEKIFSDLTEGISITQKGGKPVVIPYEKSPKFIISTNSVLSNDSDSFKARKFEIEYSDYFDAEYQPPHEFGNFFFNEGWDNDSPEWDKFFSFMMSCTMLFLNQGLIPYEPTNLSERKLMQKMPEAFIEFAEEMIEASDGQLRIYREQLYDDFVAKNKIYSPSGKNATTQTKTTKWFNDFLKFKNIVFEQGMNSSRDDRRKYWDIKL